jgi:hypothetical protein
MYNFHLHQCLEQKRKEEAEKENCLRKQLNQHKARTEQLKNRYWSRVENFMYNVR